MSPLHGRSRANKESKREKETRGRKKEEIRKLEKDTRRGNRVQTSKGTKEIKKYQLTCGERRTCLGHGLYIKQGLCDITSQPVIM